MAWDFSTEPEFQEQLDWVEEFCRTEVEPLDLVFPGAAYSRDPKAKALADPLKQQVKDRGLWALFLDRELGGPGLRPAQAGAAERDPGPLPLRAGGLRHGGARHREHGDAGGLRHRRSRSDQWLYPLMNQEIFSAYSMTEPQGGSDPSLFKTHAGPGRRRVGHQRREVVHQRRRAGPTSSS